MRRRAGARRPEGGLVDALVMGVDPGRRRNARRARGQGQRQKGAGLPVAPGARRVPHAQRRRGGEDGERPQGEGARHGPRPPRRLQGHDGEDGAGDRIDDVAGGHPVVAARDDLLLGKLEHVEGAVLERVEEGERAAEDQ